MIEPVFFNSPLDPAKSQGLVAYYDATLQQGGSELYDLVGRRNGIFTGSPTWDHGAVCGDGSSQYITLNNFISTEWTFPFTFMARIAFDAWVDGGVLIAWRANDVSYSWSFGSGPRINVTRSSSMYAADASNIVTGRVVNLTVVYNSLTSVNAYIDGIDVTMAGNDYWNMDIANVILIGCRHYSSVYSLFSDFRLEQFMVFNRALTRGEIIEHSLDPYYLFRSDYPVAYIAASGGSSSLPAIYNNYYRGLM